MTQKYVPLDKRSKKKQREFNDKQRRDWGQFSPVTRKVTNQKVYNRKKSERRYEYEPSVGFFIHIAIYENSRFPCYTDTGNDAKFKCSF